MENHYIIIELSWEGESIVRALVSHHEDITSRFAKIRQESFDKTSFFFLEEWNDDTVHPETSFIYFPHAGSMDALHRMIMSSYLTINLPAKMLWGTVMNRGYIRMDDAQREAFLDMQPRHTGMCLADKYEDMMKSFEQLNKLKSLTWKHIVRMPSTTHTVADARFEARNLGYEYFLYDGIIYYIDASGYHPTILNPEEVK